LVVVVVGLEELDAPMPLLLPVELLVPADPLVDEPLLPIAPEPVEPDLPAVLLVPPAPAPAVLSVPRLHAVRDRAAAATSASAAPREILEVFMWNSLDIVCGGEEERSRSKGSRRCLWITLGRTRAEPVVWDCRTLLDKHRLRRAAAEAAPAPMSHP
jgi:hypothetical protein